MLPMRVYSHNTKFGPGPFAQQKYTYFRFQAGGTGSLRSPGSRCAALALRFAPSILLDLGTTVVPTVT